MFSILFYCYKYDSIIAHSYFFFKNFECHNYSRKIEENVKKIKRAALFEPPALTFFVIWFVLVILRYRNLRCRPLAERIQKYFSSFGQVNNVSIHAQRFWKRKQEFPQRV